MSISDRFEKFMLSLPSIEGIDFIQVETYQQNQKKADYLGMGRKIIFEQKCITKDQGDKIQAEVEKYINDDNYPLFYGKRDLQSVIDKLPNKSEINRKIISQITKLLESYLRQADKQISSTKEIFNISNTVGVLVILNEKVKVLSPEIVAHKLQHRIREIKGDDCRFKNIDYIIYISETHNYKSVPCILIIEGKRVSELPAEVSEYINYVVNSWGQYNGGGVLEISHNNLISHLSENEEPPPDTVTASEARAIWYRNNRYMENWTDEQVARKTANHIDKIQPFFLKDGKKAPDKVIDELLMQFGDFIEESNIRGLDLKELKKYHAT